VENLSPKQKVLLLDVLSRGGESWLKDLTKSQYDLKSHRQPLIVKGYVSETKEKFSGQGNVRTRAMVKISLTDKGWELLESLAEIPDIPQVKSYAEVKARIHSTLFKALKKRSLSLKGIFSEVATEASEAMTAETLLKKIAEIDRKLFMPGGGLRLAVVRQKLPDWPEDVVNALLADLQRRERLVLYRFDSPPTEEDTRAALMMAGEPRHYLYLT
jgi:hypothetical protein